MATIRAAWLHRARVWWQPRRADRARRRAEPAGARSAPAGKGRALSARTGEPGFEPSRDFGRLRWRNGAPTDRAPQTATNARQRRRREAGGHARQKIEAEDAQINRAPTGGARSARRAPIFGIGESEIGEPHNDGAQDGARQGNNGGGRDRMKARDDGDDDGARGGIERTGARLQRASGAGRSDKDGELGHGDSRLAPRQR